MSECKHIWKFKNPELVEKSEAQLILVKTICVKCKKEHVHPTWIHQWEEK